MNSLNSESGSIMTILLIGLVVVVLIGAIGFGIGKHFQPDPGDVVKRMENDRALLIASYDAKIKGLQTKVDGQTAKIALLYKTAVLKQQRISALELKMKVIKTPQTPEDLRKRFAALGYKPLEVTKK